jgi:hypothetical protein
MNPLEIAREIFGIAINAGLKKDIVDLLEKKVGLLTEEIDTLKTQNASLKAKLYDLEQELDRLRPSAEPLLGPQEEFLNILHRQPNFPIAMDTMASMMRLEYEIVEHHKDTLQELGMIRWAGKGAGEWGKGLPLYELTDKGRKYVESRKRA